MKSNNIIITQYTRTPGVTPHNQLQTFLDKAVRPKRGMEENQSQFPITAVCWYSHRAIFRENSTFK